MIYSPRGRASHNRTNAFVSYWAYRILWEARPRGERFSSPFQTYQETQIKSGCLFTHLEQNFQSGSLFE